MNKKLITLAIATALTAPMAAMADATMYGKVRQAIDYVDMDGGADEAQITDYASRIGVKGSEDLGGGLKAVYKMEFGVRISDTNDGNGSEFSSSSDQAFTTRNAYVGLAGDWGTFLVGRHDTPLKISTGSLDYFGDQAGDYNADYAGGFSDRRANGTVAYITPNMNGLTIAAALVPGENSQADGMTDASSVAAMYSNAGFFASAAYEAGNEDIDALPAGVGDLAQYRVGLGYDAGNWRVSGVYENEELDNIGDVDKYMISAAADFGNNTIKAKYFDTQDYVDGFAIGLDHNFSKRTSATLTYVDSGYVSGADLAIWSIGVNHEF